MPIEVDPEAQAAHADARVLAREGKEVYDHLLRVRLPCLGKAKIGVRVCGNSAVMGGQ